MSSIIHDPVTLTLASLFLGLVLAAASIPKIRNADEFQGVVENYRLLPEFMVMPFSRLLPWVELACAVALLLPALREVAAWVAAGLFVMFALALAINVGRGRTHIDCGCVRRPASKSHIGMFHVMRALALAGVALYLAVVPVDPASISPYAWMVGAASAAMLTMLYLTADTMVGLPDARVSKH
ncbi:MAG TPA: MauE/DoxX family redox-associated membrane protein [Methylophilaceae bacterium]|jgi:uncharacterized membrane protein YphA (DoxX/SURF4 family)